MTFVFTVTNTGLQTISGISITDPILDAPASCDTTSLAPGQSTSCRGEYTFTQGDLDRGEVSNRATAEGSRPDGSAIRSEESTSQVLIDRKPQLVLTKEITGSEDTNGDGRISAGDTVTYRFSLTNPGNVAVAGVSVVDPKLSDAGVSIDCPVAELAPGASTECTANYVISAADADAGAVRNTAYATAEAAGQQIHSADSSADLPLAAVDSLSVEKQVGETKDVNGNGQLDAGDTIEYRFIVTNKGTRTANEVAVQDPKLQATCPATQVPAGESMECRGMYTVTQADVDAGSIQNTATVTATDPDGGTSVSEPDAVTTELGRSPGLSLEKKAEALVDANGNGRQDAGDTVSYTFTVLNTGNVTLYAMTIQDAKLAQAGVTITCPVGTLEPGQSATCSSAPYQVTSADVQAAEVSNTATAAARIGSPEGPRVVSDSSEARTALDAAGTDSGGTDSGGTDSGDTSVTSPLAITGASVTWALGIDAAVVLLGAAVLIVLAVRKRRNAEEVNEEADHR